MFSKSKSLFLINEALHRKQYGLSILVSSTLIDSRALGSQAEVLECRSMRTCNRRPQELHVKFACAVPLSNLGPSLSSAAPRTASMD